LTKRIFTMLNWRAIVVGLLSISGSISMMTGHPALGAVFADPHTADYATGAVTGIAGLISMFSGPVHSDFHWGAFASICAGAARRRLDDGLPHRRHRPLGGRAGGCGSPDAGRSARDLALACIFSLHYLAMRAILFARKCKERALQENLTIFCLATAATLTVF